MICCEFRRSFLSRGPGGHTVYAIHDLVELSGGVQPGQQGPSAVLDGRHGAAAEGCKWGPREMPKK